ncbi:GDT1-like protein 5 [Sesamum alatum]|uniref:GDT1 family protein n=1 Tax=Sesamum alatum TaxID=300844 RepID=A0AAE2CLV1_9LAMI|nr:GDT1-like protein 5 [Sesamum alatum]
MSLSLQQGFTKSLVMTMVSEFGDRTFCVAAILAMRHPRRSVFFGCLFSVIVMTVLSALVGWVAPNLDDSAASKSSSGKDKTSNKGEDDLKKQKRAFLRKFFSPVFLKAFSVTFFGEWGDKSQLATIGLAADEDTVGVILGGILGQAICTVAAVIGGKSLASRVSERMVFPQQPKEDDDVSALQLRDDADAAGNLDAG